MKKYNIVKIILVITMNEITNYIQKNSEIEKNFINKFACYLYTSDAFIEFEDIKDWIGYKKKRTVTDILNNNKYDFQQDTDFKIQKIKKEGICKPINEIYMTIDTVKCICLMAPTKKGQEFRRYYIAMEKLFRQYTTPIIQNSLTNPITEMNKYDFDEQKYYDKEVLYLLSIKGQLYKYGITQNIKKRLSTHRRLLKYKYIVKCWDCINRTVSKKIEDDVKRYFRINKLNSEYDGNTEVIKTNQIKEVINIFDKYVKLRVDEYKELFNDRKYEQKIKLIEKITEMKKIHIQELEKTIQINEKINFNNNKNDIQIEDILKIANIDETELDENNEVKESDTELDEFNNSIQFCRKCKQDKALEDFGFNEETNKYFKQCIRCRDMGKVYDKRKYGKNKNIIIEDNDSDEENNKELNKMKNKKLTKEEQKNEEKIKWEREYYEKNKSEIIERKKRYRNERINNITDPNKNYCRKCNTIKDNDEFGINIKLNEQYKQCKNCRYKQQK